MSFRTLLARASIRDSTVLGSTSSLNPPNMMKAVSTVQQVRFARVKKKSHDGAARLVTMMSVLGSSGKIPKYLKLSLEDRIRHNVISKAWALYQSQQRKKRDSQLAKQYHSIQNACEDLKATNPALFEAANKDEKGKSYDLEMRIPVETPPDTVWNYLDPNDKKKKA